MRNGSNGTNSGELTFKLKAGQPSMIILLDLMPPILMHVDINAKIYHSLTNLCSRGKASTYVDDAAEFDGYGAGKKLQSRYDGFSTQKHRSIPHCLEGLRHISGTNMADHIDTFEKLCVQMTSCGDAPTEQQKIEWFMESVTIQYMPTAPISTSKTN
jgi:hypothetical protein